VPATHRSVRIDGDLGAGTVDLPCLEDAAVDFARRAPCEVVAAAVQWLTGERLDVLIGPKGFPLGGDAQPKAPWACIRCRNRRGFRRRGQRPGGRSVVTKVGKVRLAAWQVECRACSRRNVAVLELLGLGRHQRPSSAVAEMATALATEVAYAKAARLLAELAGIDLSTRSVRRVTLSLAPARIDPGILGVPVMLLDRTGVRAGDLETHKKRVEPHLAVGLVA
jgi:hypothetical protein